MIRCTREHNIEGLLEVYVACKRREEGSARIEAVGAAQSALLSVFFEVEGRASADEMESINKVLAYLADLKTDLTEEHAARDYYAVAKEEIERLYGAPENAAKPELAAA